MKTRQWLLIVMVQAAGMALSGATHGQVPQGLTSVEAVEAEFQRDLIRVEVARIERLATLAASQPKAESSKTYEELLRFAIGVGRFNEAEPIAKKVLESNDTTPEVAMLAQLVNIVAQANRGAYEDSLKSLASAMQIRSADGDPEEKNKLRQALPLPAKISLINVYTQRLIQAGQFEVARKALILIRDSAKDLALKQLVTNRLTLIELVGKPAPAIAGTDLDGKPVRLEDYRGNVVLVVFWASWCIPNSQEVERFEQVAAANRDKGFRVIGINLDALQDGGVPVETVMPHIRRFLVEHNIRWPTLVNGTGTQDYAKAYGVTEVPTNVLIGRDGNVIHLDLIKANLVETVNKALAR